MSKGPLEDTPHAGPPEELSPRPSFLDSIEPRNMYLYLIKVQQLLSKLYELAPLLRQITLGSAVYFLNVSKAGECQYVVGLELHQPPDHGSCPYPAQVQLELSPRNGLRVVNDGVNVSYTQQPLHPYSTLQTGSDRPEAHTAVRVWLDPLLDDLLKAL